MRNFRVFIYSMVLTISLLLATTAYGSEVESETSNQKETIILQNG